MKLKTIKSKQSDTEYTKYVFREIDLIKEKCGISQDIPIYFLGYFYFAQIFLANGKIYCANVDMEYSETREPIIDTMVLTELYEITLFKDYPKTIEDIEVKTIISNENPNFSIDKFLFWIDEPCDINLEIDAPYYKVINFLNSYNKNTFSTERYNFYSKRDDDFNFILNLYAYDKKTKTEVKIYIPDIWSEKEKAYIPPVRPQDIAIEGNISNYKKLQIKKSFIELANEQNEYFNVKNFWTMELVKLAVQSVNVQHEWSLHRCFCDEKFNNIWVYDFPNVNEEPSFMLIDECFKQIAVISFKEPKYLFKDIYKRDMAKAKLWNLDEQTIKELIDFLNAPSQRTESEFYTGYKKYVKTNWQQLIFEYNHNTTGWGWGETGFDIPPEKDNERFSDIEALSFDLPIPDYTKLLKYTS